MDFYDIFEWLMEHIIGPFFVFLLLCFCAFLVFVIFNIPSCIKEEKEKEQKIEACFKQKPRTEECEYILWQYELEKKKPTHTTTAVPVFMPVVR